MTIEQLQTRLDMARVDLLVARDVDNKRWIAEINSKRRSLFAQLRKEKREAINQGEKQC